MEDRQSRLQNKKMIMDKEGNCIGIKWLDFPEDITSLSVFVLLKVVQVRISLIAEIMRLLLLLKLIGKRCKQPGCFKVCLGMSESHIWARLYLKWFCHNDQVLHDLKRPTALREFWQSIFFSSQTMLSSMYMFPYFINHVTTEKINFSVPHISLL